jgi:hypothetical protein
VRLRPRGRQPKLKGESSRRGNARVNVNYLVKTTPKERRKLSCRPCPKNVGL